MNIDVNEIEKQAREEIAAEAASRAKSAIRNQVRVVESARQVLSAEERKLQDLKDKIKDGDL